MTLLLDFAVVDPSQSLAFPMNVIALLPYMVQVIRVTMALVFTWLRNDLFIYHFWIDIILVILLFHLELRGRERSMHRDGRKHRSCERRKDQETRESGDRHDALL